MAINVTTKAVLEVTINVHKIDGVITIDGFTTSDVVKLQLKVGETTYDLLTSDFTFPTVGGGKLGRINLCNFSGIVIDEPTEE